VKGAHEALESKDRIKVGTVGALKALLFLFYSFFVLFCAVFISTEGD
jgi:hypothetical protein